MRQDEPQVAYRVIIEDRLGSTFEKAAPTLIGPRVPVAGETIIFNDRYYKVREVQWDTYPGNYVKAILRAVEQV